MLMIISLKKMIFLKNKSDIHLKKSTDIHLRKVQNIELPKKERNNETLMIISLKIYIYFLLKTNQYPHLKSTDIYSLSFKKLTA